MRWREVLLGALLSGLVSASSLAGPLPAGFEPPEGTRVLAGVDVQVLRRSPLWERVKRDEKGPFRDLEKLREETGLDVESDVDQIVVAGGPPQAGADHVLVHVSGRFNRYAMGRAIERSKKATWRSVAGTTLYMLGESRAGGGALAILDDRSLVLGARADVEALLEGRTASPRSALLDVAAGLPEAPAFWLVLDGETASSLGPSTPAPGTDGTSKPKPGPAGFALPPLRALVVSGDLEPRLRLDVQAEAKDDGAARQLADAARGLVTLASLQTAQKPELQELLAGVEIDSQGSRARLRLAIPWELLERLDRKPEPRSGPETPAP